MTAAHGPALCTRCGRPAACFGSHGARNPTHACPACCGGGECVPVRPPSDGHLVLPAPGELDADLVGLARRFGSTHAGAAARVYLHACQARGAWVPVPPDLLKAQAAADGLDPAEGYRELPLFLAHDGAVLAGPGFMLWCPRKNPPPEKGAVRAPDQRPSPR